MREPSLKRKRGPKPRYTEEFKRMAVAKTATTRLKQVADELGVSIMSLVQWRKMYRGGSKSLAGTADSAEVREGESALLMRLRQELAQVTAERDRLRKSLAILIGGDD